MGDASAVAFDDPSREWRRVVAEAIGTFLLVLVAAGIGVVAHLPAGLGLSTAVQAAAPGVTVMAVVYALGGISGAHLNPAVTWAFALHGAFPWRRTPAYLAAQLVGGLLAASTVRIVTGTIAHGTPEVAGFLSQWQAVVVEALLTAGLVLVVLGTATEARNVGPNAAIAVGAWIGVAVVWAAPLTGASMNPARSFAPGVIAGQAPSVWVYAVGPLAGATVAVLVTRAVKGPPSPEEDGKAQGEAAGG